MGVRGLLTLVHDNKEVLLRDFELHDTRLIIDGSNLFHFLYDFYHVPGEYGGNYDNYANKCKTFFTTLRACKVEPYVVLDGGYDPDNRKWNTVVQRKASRRERAGLICEEGPEATEEHVLPVLCQVTFLHVLRELQIPHVTCPYEADREIAVLANKWNCPVLSNDSDFFIFKLKDGVIPLQHGRTCFIDMKLRLHSKTEQSSLLEPEALPTNQEYTYIAVKHYHYSRLIERVCGPWEFLPIFATFSGNDYVDKTHLKSFYRAICKQYKDEPLNLRAKVRMTSIVHWSMGVQLDENAIKYVLQHLVDLSSGQKSELRAAIRYSIDSYTNIADFATMDVEKFFNADTSCISELDLGTISDYVTKNPLPVPYPEMLRTCKMAGSFMQNVAVNHRVIFDCQIEHLAEPSTYVCSRYIRSVLYGLTTSFIRPKSKNSKVKTDDLVDLKGTRKSCIEESDRQKADRMKVYIKPTTEVFYGSQSLKVPSLQNVPEKPVEERLNIMFGTLGLNSELTEFISSDPCTTFLIGVLRFWWTNAEPKVTENHLIAAIIGLILLHAEVFVEVMKRNPDASETVNLPCLVPSIVNAIKTQGNDRVIEFASKMSLHRNTPTDQASWGSKETKIIHGFSQLQTCYKSALHLNQALMSPVDLPSPGVLFNCTFMYNVCRSLDTSKDTDCLDNLCKSLDASKITDCSDNLCKSLETSTTTDCSNNVCRSLETSEITDCSEMFDLDSPLHALFMLWKSAVKSSELERPKDCAARGHKAVDKKIKIKRSKHGK
ncbi:protein asteroid homolog 1-like [Mya arenaria]|uniref:protein asteroid homolog 1-like n=1 Tax=Mya arenaria TaxID=6604 RepID=UPI0022E02C2E|nr:protein asteroid homolog 1-like [Mya arenaria]XP_052765852.1 protein asteroid homolog 1-like [Mya arenaria]